MAEVQMETGVLAVDRSDLHFLGDPVATQPDLAIRFVRDTMPHINLLNRAARSYTGNPVDAEDLVQETLLKAYRAFPAFREDTNVKAWLFRIMTNTWITSYRARQRRPEEVLGDAPEWQPASAQHSAASQSAELQALQWMGHEEVATALAALPEQFRVVVVYADAEGFKMREIAAILEIPVGTVASRLRRGRARLRGMLTNAES